MDKNTALMDKATWERIKEIFHHLEGLPLDQQQSALTQITNEPKVVREVEKLLAAKSAPDDSMTRGFANHIFSCLSDFHFDGKELKPGDSVGIYKIVSSIGRSYFNAIYLAERVDNRFQQKVAIKISRFSKQHSGWSKQSEFERQTLGRLLHPNIARIFDAGYTADGYAFIVMEYIDGSDLLSYCDKNQLSSSERLKLLKKICLALQHAHQQGIVHKDIKPDNILVETVDGEAIPKIIDFGIAQSTPIEDQASRLTQPLAKTTDAKAGDVTLSLGTPDYMSPEQLESPWLHDARNDIYALGILTFQLLGGTLPPRPKAKDLGSLLAAKQAPLPGLSQHLAKLSSAELKQLAKKRNINVHAFKRTLGPELDAIIAKATAFDMHKRYATAIELGQDIQRHILHKPIMAMPKSAVYKLRKSLRRNWLSFSLGASFCLAAIISSVLIYGSLLSENRAHEQTKAINRFLISLFSEADPTINKGEKRSVDELVDNAAKKLLNSTQLEHRYRAPLLETLGSVFSELGNYKRAAEIFEVALTEQVKSDSENSEALAQRHLDIANVLTYGHQYPEAEQHYQKAFGYLTPNSSATIRCSAYSQYGNLLRYMGQFTLALENLDLAISRCEEIAPLQHLFALENKSFILADLGKANDAITILETGLAKIEKQLGAENPHYIMGLPSLSSRYRRAGNLEKAKTNAEKGLGLALKVFGQEHEKTAHIQNMLANIHHDLGTYVSANTQYAAAEKFYRKYNAENLELAFVVNNRAALLEDREDFLGAVALYFESLKLRKALLPENHYHIGTAYLNLARVHRRIGKLEEAEKFIEQALAIYTANEPIKMQLDKVALEKAILYSNKGNPARAQTVLEQANITIPERPYAQGRYYLGMAAFADSQRETKLAFQHYQAALRLLGQELNSDHPLLHFVGVKLADYYLKNGESEKAKALIFKARPILNEHLDANAPTLQHLNRLVELAK